MTGFNDQEQTSGAQLMYSGVNADERSFIATPALHGSTPISPVYAGQTFSDATFVDFSVAGPTIYNPIDSSLAFSGADSLDQAFSPPVLMEAGPSTSMVLDQNVSTKQYPAHQGMQLLTSNANHGLASNDFAMPAAPAQSLQPALPPSQQSSQCTQTNCLMTFSRHADRIRHEFTASLTECIFVTSLDVQRPKEKATLALTSSPSICGRIMRI